MPYDQLDAMSKARSVLDDAEVIHQSRRPLRWIANWAGSVATSGILDISYMEDDGYFGWKYKIRLFLWKTFYPIYSKYGTHYKLNWDLSGPGWDDYDENGVPYWEQWHWDFVDEDTGDAFKVIKYGE